MSKLVTDQEMYDYLELDQADDPGSRLISLRDMAEDALERETNRVYGVGEVLTRESYDGPGGKMIYTRRIIASIQAIEFRYLPEITIEQYFTLDITQYITFTVGKRRIYSHVYPFPCGTDNILISYTAADDKPPLAISAVKDVVSACWNRLGSEDARSEQKGSFQHSMIRSMGESIIWKSALELLNIPSIG